MSKTCLKCRLSHILNSSAFSERIHCIFRLKVGKSSLPYFPNFICKIKNWRMKLFDEHLLPHMDKLGCCLTVAEWSSSIRMPACCTEYFCLSHGQVRLVSSMPASKLWASIDFAHCSHAMNILLCVWDWNVKVSPVLQFLLGKLKLVTFKLMCSPKAI